MGTKLGATLAILNGVVGDHLHATGNGLAVEMTVARGAPGPRVVVFLHGLMCTEDVWAFPAGAPSEPGARCEPVASFPDGTDYGALLERDLGIAPLYVRFNTGRRVADNGAELARLLEELTARHPVIEEILLVGFSMGGLVIRSATHIAAAANMRWLGLVTRAFYLGTPHLGSPWERAGRWVVGLLRGIGDPYTELVAELADVRSGGIKDLGDAAHPLPLLPEIRHHFIAGFVDARLAEAIGDALVPLASGTNGAVSDTQTIPPHHVKIIPGLAHMTLAHHPAVYAHLRAWCEAAREEHPS
ncbi:MAG: alpha/beta hydrolase [Labilithrix sp.]|nr:alpha/beta hydrolase [Labilithrix sp.]